MAECLFCGKPLPRKNKKYCSIDCQDSAYNQKRREERKRRLEKKEKQKCAREECDVYFVPKSYKHIYCSAKCQKMTYDREISIKGEIEKQKSEHVIKSQVDNYHKKIRELGVIDYMIDRMKESLKAVEPLKPRYLPKQDTYKEEETCLLISDCQIGEEVLGGDIHDLGEYNFNIFQERFDRISKAVLDISRIHRKALPINVLNIAFLGDIVNGELIFEGQYLYSQMDLFEQFFEGAYFIAKQIASLAPEFSKVRLIGVPGNHGRIGKKNQTKPHVNFDLFFYKVLEILLSEHKNLEVNFPKSFFALQEIMGHLFFFAHGDNIKSYLRTPFYGLENAAKDYFALLSRKDLYIDYFVTAHFHRQGNIQLPFGEMILNGSFVGPNVFSVKDLKTGVSPAQLFFGVNRKYGVTWRYMIQLEDSPRNGKNR